MIAAGILNSRKNGLHVLYKLKTPCILKFFDCMTEVIEHQALEHANLIESLQTQETPAP